MKKNKALFMIPSILVFLFLALFPIFKILIDIKGIESLGLSIGSIVYILFSILTVISIFVEIVYLINYLYTKINIPILHKLLWTLLIIVFNVLVIPYFYMRYISNDRKPLMNSLFYIVPIVLFLIIFCFGYSTYSKELNKINEERKRIEEERNEYITKDDQIIFTFRHGYKKEDVGEYDLYVQNKAKKVVFSAFTYETKHYEQKSADDFINKGINDISKNKEKFEVSKAKEVKEYDDKVITSVEYLGKTKESSDCIYKISVISFKNKPDYLVYVVEVVTKNNYDLYGKELLEILESSKIK